jgi:hypothetical protein
MAVACDLIVIGTAKLEMIEVTKARKWYPQDDNEADACLFLDFALSEFNGCNNGRFQKIDRMEKG